MTADAPLLKKAWDLRSIELKAPSFHRTIRPSRFPCDPFRSSTGKKVNGLENASKSPGATSRTRLNDVFRKAGRHSQYLAELQDSLRSSSPGRFSVPELRITTAEMAVMEQRTSALGCVSANNVELFKPFCS